MAAAAIAAAAHVFVPRAVATLAESVKASTGRELIFDGVEVRLLPRPTLLLQRVRFGNAAWASQPWLAQTGRVSVGIDVLALLSGRLHIRRIEAENVSALFETDRDGNGNWVRAPQSGPSGLGWLDTLEVDELTLQALTSSYRDGTTGKTTRLAVDQLDIAAPSATRPIHFSARAKLDDKALTVAGTIGAWAAALANSPAYPVDLNCSIGGASLTMRGTLDRPLGLDGLNLELAALAPDLAGPAAMFGAIVPPGSFRASARLTGAAVAPQFSAIDVELGQTHLTARGEFQGAVATDGSYEWRSPGTDLVVDGNEFGDLGDWLGRPLPSIGRYRIAAHAAGTLAAPVLSAIDVALGGGTLPEIKLSGTIADARAVSGIDLKIAATAADWWYFDAAGATPLPPFRASARVRDSREGYRVDDFDLRIADSSMSAALQIVKAGSRLRITGKAKAPLIDLSRHAPARGSNAPAAIAKSESRPPRDYWKLADLDLDLNIKRLVLPDGRRIEEGSGKIALADGRLQASAVRATFGGAKVQVDGSVPDLHNADGLELKVALQGNELADLFKYFGKTIPPVGPYQGRAALHGSRTMLGLTAIEANAGRQGQSLHVSGQIEDTFNWRGLQLAISANVSDSPAAARVFDANLPRLPAWKASARLSGPQDGYIFDDLELALGRSSLHGRVTFAPGATRPRIAATVEGPMLDLSALPALQQKSTGGDPLLATDVDAEIRFDRVVLPNRRALGPVNGGAQLSAGALRFKQLDIAVDGASATIGGSIADPRNFAGLALAVKAKVSRGAGIAAFTGWRIPDQLPEFSGSGNLTDVPDGYALSGLELSFAATTFSGDASVTRGQKRPMLRVTAISPQFDVSTLMPPTAAESAAKKNVAAGARAIPDVALTPDVLLAVDADVDLRIETLTFRDAASLGPMQLRAKIADGRLTAEPVQLDGGAGQTLLASVTVDAHQAAWTLRFEGNSVNLGEMIARLGHDKAVSGGSTDLGLDLRAHGKSLRAIFSSLNGSGLLKAGPLRVNNFAVGVGEGVVARLFSMANPFQKTDPDTDVKCVAARLQIADGLLTAANNLAVETAKYNLLMNGSVNFRTESLDFVVTPVVSNALTVGDISTIVHVGGTLAAPTLGLTGAGAVKSVASLGATLTLPGVSQLVGSIFRKAVNDPNPCATALSQVRAGNMEP